MKSMWSVNFSTFCLIVCFSLIDSTGLAEEKAAKEEAQVMIEATGRAMCEGLPIKNLTVSITLVNPQSGKEYKCKGRTDQKGVFSFRIPPGRYRRGQFSTSSSHGWSGSTMIVSPEGEKLFQVKDYFWGSGFLSGKKKSVSLGPENCTLPDLEFVPRFDVVQPADGSVVREKVPVFKWKGVEGAESYTIIIQACKPPEEGKGKRWKQILRKRKVPSTEWKLEDPLLESGMLYFVEIVAVGAEGTTVNKSRKAEFTVVGEDAKGAQPKSDNK